MIFPAIRAAKVSDASEMARLLTLLGHPSDPNSIVARWDDWERQGNRAIVAERSDGRLLGLVTLYRTLVLHRPKPLGRIMALVVDDTFRNLGIGRALAMAAESSLSADGRGLVEITSNFRLIDAHAFYEHLGYQKTSFRFAKQMSTDRDIPTA